MIDSSAKCIGIVDDDGSSGRLWSCDSTHQTLSPEVPRSPSHPLARERFRQLHRPCGVVFWCLVQVARKVPSAPLHCGAISTPYRNFTLISTHHVIILRKMETKIQYDTTNILPRLSLIKSMISEIPTDALSRRYVTSNTTMSSTGNQQSRTV
jgi:hypothetical protein